MISIAKFDSQRTPTGIDWVHKGSIFIYGIFRPTSHTVTWNHIIQVSWLLEHHNLFNLFKLRPAQPGSVHIPKHLWISFWIGKPRHPLGHLGTSWDILASPASPPRISALPGCTRTASPSQRPALPVSAPLRWSRAGGCWGNCRGTHCVAWDGRCWGTVMDAVYLWY